MRLAALALALAAAPIASAALEPRYDHRDMHGPSVELLLAHDSVAISRRPTAASWRSALRLAYGFDPTGDGNEIAVGLEVALGSFDDPDRERVLLAADARYRAWFGSEQLKTFFDVGAWVPIRSRLAAGPLVGVGLAYDFSREAGVYVGAQFATAFGEARIASVSAGVGGGLRFELP